MRTIIFQLTICDSCYNYTIHTSDFKEPPGMWQVKGLMNDSGEQRKCFECYYEEKTYLCSAQIASILKMFLEV